MSVRVFPLATDSRPPFSLRCDDTDGERPQAPSGSAWQSGRLRRPGTRRCNWQEGCNQSEAGIAKGAWNQNLESHCIDISSRFLVISLDISDLYVYHTDYTRSCRRESSYRQHVESRSGTDDRDLRNRRRAGTRGVSLPSAARGHRATRHRSDQEFAGQLRLQEEEKE